MANKYLKWQILRKGDYPQGSITDEMLQELSKTFGQRGDVPIGIGHDQYFWNDSLPAEGWIKTDQEYGIDNKGNFVVHGVDLLDPLKSAYEEGRYKKWSAVISRSRKWDADTEKYNYGKWELMAVDLLGRTAPAIKGLRDLTNQKNTAKLQKFSDKDVDEMNENIIKYADGSEREVFVFSDSFNDELFEHKQKENKKMDLEKRLAELEAKFSEKEAALTEIEKANIALSEENKTLKDEVEKTFKSYKDSEESKLDAVLSNIPEEMRKRLYKAIDETAGNNIVFSENEQKVSLYSVISEVVKQVSFSENLETDTPKIDKPVDNKDGEKIYSSGYESTKALTC